MFELTNEQLGDEIQRLAAHIDAAICEWLGMVAEFDRREVWVEWGMASTAQWLAWRCSLAPGTSREHVRVARALEGLPLVRAAFARGELSFSKVCAITRMEHVVEEQELLELAQYATAAQLERMVSAYRGVTRAEAERIIESQVRIEGRHQVIQGVSPRNSAAANGTSLSRRLYSSARMNRPPRARDAMRSSASIGSRRWIKTEPQKTRSKGPPRASGVAS